jgi:hypothetical protein
MLSFVIFSTKLLKKEKVSELLKYNNFYISNETIRANVISSFGLLAFWPQKG